MNQLRKQLVDNPYAWPGGYPLFAVTDDGAALCKECCRTEADLIDNATVNDGWDVVALYVNWEDNTLYCDHCSQQIEAAYNDD